MKNFHFTVSIDRPNTGVDTVLDQAGEFTSENLQVVSSTIQTALGNFENETDDTKFEVDATVVEGDESLTVTGKASKSTILKFVQVIQEMNQTPPIYVPDPPLPEAEA